MELTVLERLVALQLLPEEGRIGMMRLRQNMIGKLGLDSDDIEKFEYVEEDNTSRWNRDIPQEVEINLKPAEIVLLQDALKKLDEEGDGKIKPEHVSLYDKIVDDD